MGRWAALSPSSRQDPKAPKPSRPWKVVGPSTASCFATSVSVPTRTPPAGPSVRSSLLVSPPKLSSRRRSWTPMIRPASDSRQADCVTRSSAALTRSATARPRWVLSDRNGSYDGRDHQSTENGGGASRSGFPPTELALSQWLASPALDALRIYLPVSPGYFGSPAVIMRRRSRSRCPSAAQCCRLALSWEGIPNAHLRPRGAHTNDMIWRLNQSRSVCAPGGHRRSARHRRRHAGIAGSSNMLRIHEVGDADWRDRHA